MNPLSSSMVLARDVMNPEAVPLKPGKFEKNLVLQFLSGQYCGWPVVDPTQKILGVVTEFRLLQAVSRVNSLDDLRVEDIMDAPVYVYDTDPLNLVLKTMVQKQLLRIPVVGERNLVGVISRGQVIRHCLPLASSSTRFVSSCGWCERVHDPSEPSIDSANEWRELTSFLTTHHLSFSDLELVTTYCPSCLQGVRGTSTTTPSLSPQNPQSKKDRSCLLVVDDDPSVTGIISEALTELGYEVLVAGNGREGLNLVERRSVDGILLDMQMPVMDGRTMLDELRWLGHSMPVLMMSGGSDERVLRQLLREGAQGFFLKPFHLSSLKQACRQVFHKNDQAEIEESVPSHSHVA
jgi:CheY-like chemotaxis protein/predicted transcriptional regulator